MKLVHLDHETKLARVKCPCGGETTIPTADASARIPQVGWCPLCARALLYPDDLQT